ncbi:hypothetical protein DENIS_0076 [Desulfonema ishimotonii]|uniref:Chemotaxis protein CheW n=1 Tax=Desulfonema ishimotonii TaxID=45657 RepID=A0A401FQA7_9BACT|nr:hypothetical protein [Desulfonema ishimotonii]GBC59140.1 hypothetical protein DENIS_0076 [Desulfonema ishimotonii]
MQPDSLKDITRRRVLIVPARTPRIRGKSVRFLFTFRQVRIILRELAVLPVPFSAPHIDGIAFWHDHVLPVIVPEKCLGLESPAGRGTSARMILIRTGDREQEGLLNVAPDIRIIPLAAGYRPVRDTPWRPQPRRVRGMYEGPDELLIIPHMENILSGR